MLPSVLLALMLGCIAEVGPVAAIGAASDEDAEAKTKKVKASSTRRIPRLSITVRAERNWTG